MISSLLSKEDLRASANAGPIKKEKESEGRLASGFCGSRRIYLC